MREEYRNICVVDRQGKISMRCTKVVPIPAECMKKAEEMKLKDPSAYREYMDAVLENLMADDY